jgi:hypothetical protein
MRSPQPWPMGTCAQMAMAAWSWCGRRPLLVGVRVHDGFIHGRRLLECDISTQWLIEASHEQLDLVGLDGLRIAARKSHEPVAKGFDRPLAAKNDELVNWTLGERRAEALVDQLDEVVPQRRPAVVFKHVIPKLSIIQ